VVYLDTHDGKLGRAGIRLRLEKAADRLRWRATGPAGEEGTAPLDFLESRRTYSVDALGLTAGVLEIAKGRPLIPYLAAVADRRSCSLVSPSGARLALALESQTPSLPRGRRPPGPGQRQLTAALLEGEESALQHLGTYLRDRVVLSPETQDLPALGLKALGRIEPGGPVPLGLRVRAADPLAAAARKVVAQQALKMRANTEGTVEDLDPEYLHDLRVATRRLRSALRLFGPALGPRRAESLRVELAWIGRLLGAVRDLDVFIANLRVQEGRLGESAPVAVLLARELEERRVPARETLISALSGRRYAALIRRLEALGASPAPRTARGVAKLPVAQVGPAMVQRANRRVLALGRSVTETSPPEQLHRLRILFKRLRYASEFFREAFDDLEPFIRAMVRFQDCLGEHQDAVVAMGRIRSLAAESADQGKIPPEALLDLGALLQVQREIAADRRLGLQALWEKFDRPSVRRIPKALGAKAGTEGRAGKPETNLSPGP
jgi:CHAD domain-containing protein